MLVQHVIPNQLVVVIARPINSISVCRAQVFAGFSGRGNSIQSTSILFSSFEVPMSVFYIVFQYFDFKFVSGAFFEVFSVSIQVSGVVIFILHNLLVYIFLLSQASVLLDQQDFGS